MPEILEIDDEEAERMQQEAAKKKAQEEAEHAQGTLFQVTSNRLSHFMSPNQTFLH